jgi:hypothetical protein
MKVRVQRPRSGGLLCHVLSSCGVAATPSSLSSCLPFRCRTVCALALSTSLAYATSSSTEGLSLLGAQQAFGLSAGETQAAWHPEAPLSCAGCQIMARVKGDPSTTVQPRRRPGRMLYTQATCPQTASCKACRLLQHWHPAERAQELHTRIAISTLCETCLPACTATQ